MLWHIYKSLYSIWERNLKKHNMAMGTWKFSGQINCRFYPVNSCARSNGMMIYSCTAVPGVFGKNMPGKITMFSFNESLSK